MTYILAFCKSSLELQAFGGTHMQVHSLARTIKSSCCCVWWFELWKCLRVCCIKIYVYFFFETDICLFFLKLIEYSLNKKIYMVPNIFMILYATIYMLPCTC